MNPTYSTPYPIVFLPDSNLSPGDKLASPCLAVLIANPTGGRAGALRYRFLPESVGQVKSGEVRYEPEFDPT